MATNRFQFSDDFVLKNGKVGINTAEPQEKLEVLGTIIADNIRASDISNLHTYEGFLNQNQNIDENLTLSSDTTTSLSGEIIVGDDATVTIGSEATSSQGNIDSLKVYNTFTVPVGGTEDRPRKVKPGQLYYNVDFKTIEFWDGNVWRQVDNTTRSGRGVFGSGYTPSATSVIDYVNISTLGNALSFGNLTVARWGTGSCSSSIRGIYAGGTNPSPIPNTNYNIIDYITIASEGNAIDFGDRTVLMRGIASCSSSTRGLFAGGYTPTFTNVIDYIEISTLGSALDFGDMTFSGGYMASTSSSTRAVFCAGFNPSLISTIDFATISSKGNSVFFGNLTQARFGTTGCSSSTRGIIAGGAAIASQNTIDYITIASTGNAIYFGDLTQAKHSVSSSSSSIRGIIAGGYRVPATINVNNIDYVTISTLGNALDFGDLTVSRGYFSGLSDSHGGLGGF